jgi:hypothetical protein
MHSYCDVILDLSSPSRCACNSILAALHAIASLQHQLLRDKCLIRLAQGCWQCFWCRSAPLRMLRAALLIYLMYGTYLVNAVCMILVLA